MDEVDLLSAMKKLLHEALPSGSAVYAEAIDRELGMHRSEVNWIKSRFSELVDRIQVVAYEIYQDAERTAASVALGNTLCDVLPKNPTPDLLVRSMEQHFGALNQFFLSLTQGRRARAGKAFEEIIRALFDRLGYPYSPQPVINGQPDFLLPSETHFQRNPMDCIIFTVKRTLRERWRQIVTEGTRGFLFFLATIDGDISSPALQEIQRNRIYLVMPERIRQQSYPKHPNVISFETFFEDHLDPAMKRWRRNKVIQE